MIAVELTFCEGSSMSAFLSTKSSAMETQTQTTHHRPREDNNIYFVPLYTRTMFVPCHVIYQPNTLMIPSVPPFHNRLAKRKTALVTPAPNVNSDD